MGPNTLDITGLPAGNTFYFMELQYSSDPVNGIWTTYPGGLTTSFSLAGVPVGPNLINGGHNPNIYFDVFINPADLNTPDSMYAIQVQGPNGVNGYLNQTSGGTDVCQI